MTADRLAADRDLSAGQVVALELHMASVSRRPVGILDSRPGQITNRRGLPLPRPPSPKTLLEEPRSSSTQATVSRFR